MTMELLLLVAFFLILGWCLRKAGAWLEKVRKEVAKNEASQALYQREMLSSTRALESALVPRDEAVSVKLARAQQALEERRNTRLAVEKLCDGGRP